MELPEVVQANNPTASLSLAFLNAGNNNAASIEMIAMTTKSSTNVNASRRLRENGEEPQHLRIGREVAPVIFQTPSFAMKGGTAINLFFSS